jgi:glycine cleavage system H lipoate-binding protein
MYEEDSKVYKLTRIGSDSISIFDQNDERYYAREWIEKCCANASPLSLTPYTNKDWGDIISIKLMGSNGKFETGNCMTREEESELYSDQPFLISD